MSADRYSCAKVNHPCNSQLPCQDAAKQTRIPTFFLRLIGILVCLAASCSTAMVLMQQTPISAAPSSCAFCCYLLLLCFRSVVRALRLFVAQRSFCMSFSDAALCCSSDTAVTPALTLFAQRPLCFLLTQALCPKALTAAAPTFSCSGLALSFAGTALCSENCVRERESER